MRGQVVYMYAYDVAYEIDLNKVRAGLSRAEFRPVLPEDKTVPRDFPFYQPLHVGREPITVASSLGKVTVNREAKIFALGAISISLRVDFEVPGLGSLIPYHSLSLTGGESMAQIAARLCEELLPAVLPHALRPVEDKGNPEAYTVFCLKDLGNSRGGKNAQAWLDEWRGEVAGLLTEEEAFDRLSDSEIKETTRLNYSYTTDDLAVIDWDGALLVDPEGTFDDLLYILEVANVQLTEFQIYDRTLERFLDKAYDDVEAYSRKPPLLKGPGPILGRLKGVLMDLTKMAEEITNITKFFGDWHLARIYLGCSERFHLKEWENSLEEKLKTLDNLYKMLNDDMNNRRMLLLEAAIVVLFVVDVAKLLVSR
ncbi:MAG TPA: hypothetical protein VNI01_00490 [Elusimicrobiota bacterium]|nr:hypothetical protein [Elusimicrobiota bacterium]